MNNTMEIQIPKTAKKRVVIIGGGFGGITLADKLDPALFQTVLIDKYNYHQFQPLLYQLTSSGLDVGSITFSFRKLFRKKKDFYFRLAEVHTILHDERRIETSIGTLDYDYLVIAAGTTTNFFGNKNIQEYALPMKSVEEALALRNKILLNLERALDTTDAEEKQALLNIVIVGGGATGVEVAGALAEMKKFVAPKDYPDLRYNDINIYLMEGTSRLLAAMAEESSANALESLEKMGVKVILNQLVTDYDGTKVKLNNGSTLLSKTLIWVSGVVSQEFGNIPKESYGRGNRLIVDEFNRLKGYEHIFAIGDNCLQTEEAYPYGHPQVAPVAIQQGRLLAGNLKNMLNEKEIKPFRYNNQGTLATIGRNKAVADINKIHLKGFPAWAVWMLVHLRSILGVKNKLVVLIDWIWNYFTYDLAMRLILFAAPEKPEDTIHPEKESQKK